MFARTYRRPTRRQFLRIVVGGTAAFGVLPLLAACGSSAPPAPTAAPAAAPTSPPAAAPTAAPAAPTTAPAAAAAPTTAPVAAAPTAAPAAAPTAAPAATVSTKPLVVAVSGTAASIDGEQALTAEGEMLMANIHAGDLFKYKIITNDKYKVQEVDLKSSGDKGVEGLLADSWQTSQDGKVITITLKQGMKSPYGNEFTADDYKWAWDRRIAIKGPGKFFADVLGIGPDSVKVLDKHKVEVTLKGPSPIFFKLLAQCYYGGPFDSTEAKKHATSDDPWAKEWLRTNAAGFGPYHVEKLTPDVETVLVANPNWGGAPVSFQRVILKAVPESSARLSLLKSGQVDIAWGLNERELKEVEADPNLKVTRAPSNKQNYVGLVVSAPPLDNQKVRQALAWATPYQDIIDKVYLGHARRMTSTVPDIYAGSVVTYKYDTDLAKAKALLGEAGQGQGFDLTLSYNASEKEAEETAILLKSNWEQIGLRVNLQAMPTGVYADQKYGKKLQAFAENQQWPWTGDPGYSSWVYLANGPDNFINAVNFNNPEYNDVVEKAMRMLDSPEREKLTTRAQEIAADQVPWIQVAWFEWSVPSRKSLEGLLWTPDNQLRFYAMRNA